MAEYYTKEYAIALYQMTGIGKWEDYLYWTYDGLGADPTFFLEEEEWQAIQSDWSAIEDQVNINC